MPLLFVMYKDVKSSLHFEGYFSRHAALEELMNGFLSLLGSDSPCQILSLGAGFDTSWFNLKSQGRAPSRYFEVDFQEVHNSFSNPVASLQKQPVQLCLKPALFMGISL